MPHPKQDLAWKHCETIKEGKRVYVKCKFCGKMFKGGGIFRFKEHLAGRKGGGPMCQCVPPDVRLLMEQILDGMVDKNSISSKVDVRPNYAGMFSDIIPSQFGNEDGTPGKRRKKDFAWDHCQSLENGKRVQIKCNYCGKLFKGGGIFRFKEHLAGRKGSAPICLEVPSAVRELMLQNLSCISGEPRKKLKSVQNDCNAEEDENQFSGPYNGVMIAAKACQSYHAPSVNGMDDLEGVSIGELHGGDGDRGAPLIAGDMIGEKSLVYSVDNSVQLAIGRFLFEMGIAGEAPESCHLQPLLDMIGFGGAKFVPPSHNDLSGWILKKLVEEARKDIADLKAVWRKLGCTILVEEMKTDGGRVLLNFMACCSHGTVFLKSVEASGVLESEDELHRVVKEAIEEVGAGNVLQVITNCGERYAALGRRLMETFPCVYWAPCAAQCVDMILDDFCKLEWVSSVIEQARSVTRFIYNHSAVLNLMKRFTSGSNIVQKGPTRCSASLGTIKQMADLKVSLQTMVTSQEWVDSPYSEQLGGLALLDIVTNDAFWSSCFMIIRLTSPLMRLLEMLGSENRATMGYVFAGIYRAKEAVKKALVKSDDYMVYWNIIDARWEQLWKCPLQAAAFFLNPKCFYSTQGELHNEIPSRVYDCIERLVPDAELQDKIVKELNLYKTAGGDLGRKMAIRGRDVLLPAEWWSTYGGGCSNLMRMAVRILSQPCSLHQRDVKGIAFDSVYETRNRLERQRRMDSVFVQYNLCLKRQKQRRGATDKIEEWIMQNDLCLNEEGNLDWMALVQSSIQTPSNHDNEQPQTGFDDVEILFKS